MMNAVRQQTLLWPWGEGGGVLKRKELKPDVSEEGWKRIEDNKVQF